MYFIDKDRVFWKKIGNELVILDIVTGSCFSLDKVSCYIWNMILQGYDIEDMATKLVNKYKVKKEKARQDIGILVANLEKEKIIEIVYLPQSGWQFK